MTDPEKRVDVRDVLRSYGWECGPEFEHRYVTDVWVFNLVNIIERQAVEIQEIHATGMLDATEPEAMWWQS